MTELRAAWRPCLAIGAVRAALPFWLVAWGEKHIDSGVASIAQATVPIFTLLLGWRFLPHEHVRGLQIVGVAVGLAGVTVLTGVDPSGGWWAVAGTLAVVLSSLSYASGNVIGKRNVHDTPGPVLATGAMLAAGLYLLVPGLLQFPTETPTAGALASLLALALIGTALAQLVFYRALRLYGSNRVSLVTYLMPGFALVYGAVLLDERITTAALGGLALILLGVALGWVWCEAAAGAPQSRLSTPFRPSTSIRTSGASSAAALRNSSAASAVAVRFAPSTRAGCTCRSGSGRRSRDAAGRALRPLGGGEVARPHLRPPARDREKGDVEVGCDRLHAREQIGVAGEVHRARTADHEPERLRLDAERTSVGIVTRLRRGDRQRADANLFAGLHLGHVLEAPLAEEAARPPRDDEGQRAPEPLERRKVEVIEVHVRNERRVDASQGGRVRRPGSAQVHHAGAEHRIGEEPHPVEIDEDGGVPQPADAPVSRRGAHRSADPIRRSTKAASRIAAPSTSLPTM